MVHLRPGALTAVAEHLQLVVVAGGVGPAEEALGAGAGDPLPRLGRAELGAGRPTPHLGHLVIGAEAGGRAQVVGSLWGQAPSRHGITQ